MLDEYGLAIDLGTTNLVGRLVNLRTGDVSLAKSVQSPQMQYGPDVITRIARMKEYGFDALREALLVGEGLLEERLTPKNGKIVSRYFVGNTIMEHFAAGMDPSSIAVPPFTPVSLFQSDRVYLLEPENDPDDEDEDGWENLSRPDFMKTEAWKAVLSAMKKETDGLFRPEPENDPDDEDEDGWENLPGPAEETFRLAPCVSGYVGGDITSGLAVLGLDRTEELTLFVDIGTNGEIALGNKHGFLTAATAAGPCFSGAGEKGSVLISFVAAALKSGAIGPSGRLLSKKGKAPEEPSGMKNEFSGEGKTKAGKNLPDDNNYISVTDVSGKTGCLSRNDVRNYQLAKGAVRAGIETLLEACGKEPKDLQKLVVAGDFGGKIDIQDAICTGLLPVIPAERILQPGNTALEGAVLGLTEEGRKRILETAKLCRYYDLSGSEAFQRHFLRHINFR